MLINTIKKKFESPDIEIIEVDRYNGFIPVTDGKEKPEGFDPNKMPKTHKGKPVFTSEHNVEEDNKARSYRRARKMVKTLGYNNICKDWKFVTLTYAGTGQFSQNQVKKDVKQFISRLEEYTGRDIKYLGVLEYHHTDHGLHVHLVGNLPYVRNDILARKLWQKGFVKINALDWQKRKRGLIDVINYLLKYIRKDADSQGRYNHTYLRSRNLNQEVQCKREDIPDGEYDAFIARLELRGFTYVEEYTVKLGGEAELNRKIYVRYKK